MPSGIFLRQGAKNRTDDGWMESVREQGNQAGSTAWFSFFTPVLVLFGGLFKAGHRFRRHQTGDLSRRAQKVKMQK